MGGSYEEALAVPIDLAHRYFAFYDLEEYVKLKQQEAEAQSNGNPERQ